MSKESKNQSAARKAVERGGTAQKEERTPEKRLKDIRVNLAARLAVTPDDQRWLLELYDQKKAENESALALLNQHLTGRIYDSLDDALRNLLQAYISLKDQFEDAKYEAKEMIERLSDNG